MARTKAKTQGAAVDELFFEVLRAGENIPELREVLNRLEPDDLVLLAVLRRAVPVKLLEFLAATAPWSEGPRLLAGVVQNPRVPRPLASKLVAGLYWRDLADVAANMRVAAPVRLKAEDVLRERLPDMRLGEKIALAKIATLPVAILLLGDADRRVTEACLINPRLREEDLVRAVRSETVSEALLDQVSRSSWGERYGIRLALVRQGRTPLGVALSQLRWLARADLRGLVADPGVRPLLRAAAERIIEGEDSRGE